MYWATYWKHWIQCFYMNHWVQTVHMQKDWSGPPHPCFSLTLTCSDPGRETRITIQRAPYKKHQSSFSQCWYITQAQKDTQKSCHAMWQHTSCSAVGSCQYGELPLLWAASRHITFWQNKPQVSQSPWRNNAPDLSCLLDRTSLLTTLRTGWERTNPGFLWWGKGNGKSRKHARPLPKTAKVMQTYILLVKSHYWTCTESLQWQISGAVRHWSLL